MIGLRRLRAGFPSWPVIGLSLLTGAVLSLGQAPIFAWYLAFPALIFALWQIVGAQGAAASAMRAWLIGAGYFAAYLNWIVSPFFIEPLVYGWMAPFAVLLMSFGLALFWAGAAALSSVFGHSGGGVLRPWRKALGLAALLALFEMVRGQIFTGFPWAMVGHLWLGSPIEQLASVVGASGLTALSLIAAALPIALGRVAGGIGAVLVIALAFGFGQWRLSQPAPEPRLATVRLVQPNAEQHLKWDPDQARDLFHRQLQLTAQDVPADLTIWPETAVPYLLEYSPEVAPIITEAAGGNKVALGIQRVEGDRGWNSLRVLAGDGALLATYDKFHLVPFGEYMPAGEVLFDWFGISAFAAQSGNGYSAGAGPEVIDLGPELGRVLPLICYEAVFPYIPHAAPERADWIMQVTNDAWFGTLTGPFQHFALSRLRAVEFGLPVLRSANTGVTAVIDAHGRALAQLPFGVAGALDLDQIPGALPATIYARFGDWLAILIIFMTAIVAAGLPGRRIA